MSKDRVEEEGVRLDQWLHAARFFKTRALAAAAVKAHRVTLNEMRVKPARPVRRGDRLDIVRGHERMSVDVLDLSKRRGPATVAQTLYAETADSARLRAEQAEQRRLANADRPQPARRPDKRSRRRLIRFLRDTDGSDR